MKGPLHFWANAGFVLVTFIASLSFVSPAAAQANFEASQLGGRTAMMGGAVVAMGEDEATAFVNPAGITRIPGQSFSFSTFAITIRNRSMSSPLDASDRLDLDDTNVNRLQLRILPNTFCLFLDGPPKDTYSGRSRHKYAICGASTEREEFDFTRARRDVNGSMASATSHATNMKFVRSTVAASWGLALSRDTSIGVTFRTDNTRFRDDTNATAYAAEGNAGRLQTVMRSTLALSWDTSVVIGLTSYLSRNITLGASLTTPSQHLLGRYTGLSSTSSTGGLPHSTTQDTGDFRYNHPGSLRLGLGFTWPRLLVELDGSFYGPQKQLARANFDRATAFVQGAGITDGASAGMGNSLRASIVERGRPVTNLSLGTEYFLERDFALIAGLQTDFSGIHPRETSPPTDVLFRQEKDSYHAAIGVSTYGEQGRLLLGIRGQFSRGSVLMADAALQEPAFVALPQSEWALSVVLAGQVSFRTVRDAARAAAPRGNAGGSERTKRKENE